jgi:hypothetical protein
LRKAVAFHVSVIRAEFGIRRQRAFGIGRPINVRRGDAARYAPKSIGPLALAQGKDVAE